MSISHNVKTKKPESIIAPDGYRGMIVLFLVTLGMLYFKHYYLAGLHFFLVCFIAFFFRNPKRVIPDTPGALVSPADGKIVGIDQVEVAGHSEPYTKVSIFLSIFNVHINRSPLAGKVESLDYTPGKFLAAFNGKASSDNEQTAIRITGTEGSIIVKQIAGLIARRIVCWIKPGNQLEKGERIGLIRFGSRVELFVPEKLVSKVKINMGDMVKGGETIIALLHERDPEGRAREE